MFDRSEQSLYLHTINHCTYLGCRWMNHASKSSPGNYPSNFTVTHPRSSSPESHDSAHISSLTLAKPSQSAYIPRNYRSGCIDAQERSKSSPARQSRSTPDRSSTVTWDTLVSFSALILLSTWTRTGPVSTQHR